MPYLQVSRLSLIRNVICRLQNELKFLLRYTSQEFLVLYSTYAVIIVAVSSEYKQDSRNNLTFIPLIENSNLKLQQISSIYGQVHELYFFFSILRFLFLHLSLR